MRYRRLPIEIEAPEQLGPGKVRYNLTESSCTDLTLKDLGMDLGEVVLGYTDHAGLPALRAAISADGAGLLPEDVLVTAGAASALFIAATSLLEEGDAILVARPNYATNIETPRLLGCRMDYLDLKLEEGFRVDPEEIARRITPQTKLVSLTCPHNPTGAMMTQAELRRVVAVVEERGCRLLFDETYREMAFGETLPMAASLSPIAISVSSISKTYGVPGLRMGWLACKDAALMETFLAAKEQIYICNSALDEEIARRLLQGKAARLPAIRQGIAERLAVVKAWMAGQKRLEWVEPQGGVACFPRMKSGVDVDLFYRTLNEELGAFVGPGHWFEMDRRFMRIGYGWPNKEALSAGLEAISRALLTAG